MGQQRNKGIHRELAQGVSGVSEKPAMNGGVKHFDLLFLCMKSAI